MNTADTETTSSGKEVLSGWQRCIILERLGASEDNADGSVTVKYLDDDSDDEPIEYAINDFINSADPAPNHVDLIEDVTPSVAREQPLFEMPERGELVPLQRKLVSKPENNNRLLFLIRNRMTLY